MGVVYAGYLAGTAQITAAGALALSLGIAIQNFPEGAIISMPLRRRNAKTPGVLGRSTIWHRRAHWGSADDSGSRHRGACFAYLLSFAAGAMLYVVVEELIPEMSQGQHSNVGTMFFAVGFSVMMVLDVALG